MRALVLVGLVVTATAVLASCSDNSASPAEAEMATAPLLNSSGGTDGTNLRTHLASDEEVPPTASARPAPR